MLRGPETISPTAHYTGDVWARHGIGPPELATLEGRLAHHALAPAMALSRAVGGPTLEGLLLARHRVIDHLLAEAIDAGRIGHVVELAAGMSPRGHAFTARYGDRLTYVETDLPGMVARKQRALARLGARHRVEVLDARRDDGPGSLAAVVAGLDPAQGLAVVSEGLLNYLPRAVVEELWRRIARVTGRFAAGLHVSDLHLRGENGGPAVQAFATLLGVSVRGRIHFHFAGEPAATEALHRAGFVAATLLRPRDLATLLPGVDGPGSERVRVVAATTRAAGA